MDTGAPTTPPERLAGTRVVLEKADLAFLDEFQAAIEASHPELHQYMDWANNDEPQSREVTAEYLESRGPAWDTGEAFAYLMRDPATGEIVGGCGLMNRRGPGRLEIGYWVRSDRTGAGIATETAALLTEAALTLEGVEIVQIHHDAANVGSGRVPEKLGYREAARHETEIDSPGECGVEVVWEISRATRS